MRVSLQKIWNCLLLGFPSKIYETGLAMGVGGKLNPFKFKRYRIDLAMWGFPSKGMGLVEAMGVFSQFRYEIGRG